MTDTNENLSASQHAQLLIAEALGVIHAMGPDGSDDATRDAVATNEAAIAAAIASGKADDVIAMLASAVVGAWTAHVMTLRGIRSTLLDGNTRDVLDAIPADLTVGQVIATAFAGWDTAEQGWRDGGLRAAQ